MKKYVLTLGLVMGLFARAETVESIECFATTGSYAKVSFNLITLSKNQARIEGLKFSDQTGNIFADFSGTTQVESSQMMGKRQLEMTLGFFSYLDLERSCKKLSRVEFDCAKDFSGTYLLAKQPIRMEKYIDCKVLE